MLHSVSKLQFVAQTVQEVHGLNLGWDTNTPDWFLMVYFGPSMQIQR
jgi:hypothetical protein